MAVGRAGILVAVASTLAALPASAQSAPDEDWGLPSNNLRLAPPAPLPPPAPEPTVRGAPTLSPLDESWRRYPSDAPPPVQKETAPALLPPTSPPPPPPLPMVVRRAAPLVPEEANRVSMYGAPALGQWKRGLGLYIGFPLLGVRGAIGLTPQLDVGLGFDSFFGWMNEIRVHAKYQLYAGANWSAAVALEGGKAFFAQPPSAESNGARWLTGRRNWNIAPGVLVSYRGDSPRSARLFLDVRYNLALDTQPYQRDPLGGVPASVQLGHNVPIRFGAEMPFTSLTSFLFTLGFDLHGRVEDSNFMPVCAVGIVTSL